MNSKPTIEEAQCPYLHTSPECLQWHVDNTAPLNQTHYLPTKNPTIDEILEEMAFSCAGGITDNGAKEFAQAKQQLTELIADIVGKDDKDPWVQVHISKQRQRALERGIDLTT